MAGLALRAPLAQLVVAVIAIKVEVAADAG
jgi:hypothetical protein